MKKTKNTNLRKTQNLKIQHFIIVSLKYEHRLFIKKIHMNQQSFTMQGVKVQEVLLHSGTLRVRTVLWTCNQSKEIMRLLHTSAMLILGSLTSHQRPHPKTISSRLQCKSRKCHKTSQMKKTYFYLVSAVQAQLSLLNVITCCSVFCFSSYCLALHIWRQRKI